MLESRLAVEAELARQANEQRAVAGPQVEAEERSDRIAWAISGALVAAAFAVWLVLFIRSGREYRPGRRVKYLREVPEGMPPALVGALWRMGAVGDDDLAATLLDLAVSGVLKITPGGHTPEAAASAKGPPAPTPARRSSSHSTARSWTRPTNSPSRSSGCWTPSSATSR